MCLYQYLFWNERKLKKRVSTHRPWAAASIELFSNFKQLKKGTQLAHFINTQVKIFYWEWIRTLCGPVDVLEKKNFFFFFSSLFKAEHLQKKIIIRSVDWKSSDHLFPSECISLSVAKTITSQRGLNGSSETNSRVEATGSTIGDAGAGTGGWSGVGTSDQTSSDCGLTNKTSSDSGLSNQTSSELLSAESSSNSRLCSKTYSSVSTETSSQLCSCLIWIEYYISCTRF